MMTENTNQAYDIIGDIHGCASELEILLTELGYREIGSAYCHPDGRKAVFLGDYIDRGPEIRRTLQIVRGMIDAEQAFGILGNHEINALRYHQNGPDGEPLRPHTESKIHQHRATLEQIANPARQEWSEWLYWFSTLPLWLELDGVRAVHASWFDQEISLLRGHGHLIGDELYRLSRKGHYLEAAMERILCGVELSLPQGEYFKTPDGMERTEIRARWWDHLEGKNCREAVFPYDPKISEADYILPKDHAPYPSDAPPVFFGHFAVPAEFAAPLRDNVACLDYGGARGGHIGAYRWDGESQLQRGKFVLSPQTSEH